jgi:hypothetical protein
VNTAIRLLVLIPAVPVSLFVALIFLAWSPLTLETFAISLTFVVAPSALIVWTTIDHRKRRRAHSKLRHGNYAQD